MTTDGFIRCLQKSGAIICYICLLDFIFMNYKLKTQNMSGCFW
jgi:hypothetical protein